MSFFRKIPARAVVAALLLTLPTSSFAQRKKKASLKAQQESSVQGDFKSIGAPLPPIRGVYPDKAVYTNAELQNGANLFVMLFNPTCEHCQDMTAEFRKHISLFRKSNILLLAAPGMGPYLEFFDNTTHVSETPAIKVALDSSDFIQKTFRYESLPQVNVYSPDGKLLKAFSGITTIDSLKPFIQ